MNETETTKPTTLEGLKRRAKSLKKLTDCKHMEALHAVAKDMGFQNYMSALAHFKAKGEQA